MKKYLLSICIFSYSLISSAQTVDWARQASDAGLSRALGVNSDSYGNLYVAGTVTPTTTLDTITLNSLGAWDAYVAKYDRNGNIQWAISFGGSGNDEAFDIATDLAGNSFVTGYVGTNAVIGTYVYSSSFTINFFMLKVNASGVIQWVKFLDNTGGLSEGKAIAVDPLGFTVAVTGFFRGSADFDSIHIVANYEDVFTAKLNGSTGNVDWVRTGGGSSDDEGQGVALDNAKNVIVTGYYKATATFDSVTFPTATGHDIFMIKYHNSGTILWTKYASGPGHDDGYKVKTDSYSNIFLEGLYENGIDFDGTVLSSNGAYDAFLNKYDEHGNLKWIIHGGGSTPNYEIFSGFAFDAYGYLWCTGFFSGPSIIDTFNVNAQGSDIVLCRIDTSGQILNVVTYGGPGDDFGYAIAYVPECYIAVAGSFNGTGSFGMINMTSGGGDDACVVHVDATCTIGVNEQMRSAAINVYPNPSSGQFTVETSEWIENAQVRLYNSLGQVKLVEKFSGMSKQIFTKDLPEGVYMMGLESNGSVYQKRVQVTVGN